MRVEVINAGELSSDQLDAWWRLQRGDPLLDSPFFAPDFTQLVASVRGDVRVGILRRGQQVVGFFPFQRLGFGRGAPVGEGFNEFHGVVAERDLPWDLATLLGGCRLTSWRYDHVPAAQLQFVPFHARVGDSPYIDLSGGYDAYCADKRRAGAQVIAKSNQAARKLDREVGEVRFEFHRGDQLGIDKLLAWKSAQHQRTSVPDVFQQAWVVELLQRVRDARSDRFRGMLSLLYAGDQPVAVHLGMRNERVAHMWYPAYDPQFGKYSPGMILFLRMARELARQGVQRVDFGPGGQPYKQRLKSGDIAVALGAADRFAAARQLRRAWRQARHWARSARRAVAAGNK